MSKTDKKKTVHSTDLAIIAGLDKSTIDTVFGTIRTQLEAGKAVTIMGFGTFDLVECQGRGTFISPLTQKEAYSPDYLKPRFNPSKIWKAEINGRDADNGKKAAKAQ